MGFVHYSLPNGDREDFDDEQDYTLEKKELEQKSLIVKMVEEKKVLDEPICFNIRYSEDRIYKYKNVDNSKYYLWYAIKDYTQAVKNFYAKLMQEFACSNKDVKLKDFVKETTLNQSIENYAEELRNAEKNLLRKVDYSKGKAVLDNKPIYELLNFGCKAWIIYFCQTQVKKGNKTFFDLAIDFEKDAKQMDLENDFDVANLFSMQTKIEMYIKNHIKQFNCVDGKLNVVDSAGYWLYKHLNPVQLFEEVIMETKGYSSISHKSTTLSAIKNVKDETALNIIELFKDYGKIKWVIKRMKNLENPTYTPNESWLKEFRYYEKFDDEEEDVYKLALSYKQKSKDLLASTPDSYRMFSDLAYFCSTLENTIKKNEQLYVECEKQINEIEIKYFKNN